MLLIIEMGLRIINLEMRIDFDNQNMKEKSSIEFNKHISTI